MPKRPPLRSAKPNSNDVLRRQAKQPGVGPERTEELRQAFEEHGLTDDLGTAIGWAARTLAGGNDDDPGYVKPTDGRRRRSSGGDAR